MRLQTNIEYANWKKWDGICFYEKAKEIIVPCRISWRGCNSIKNGTETQMYMYAGITLCKNRNLFDSRNDNN